MDAIIRAGGSPPIAIHDQIAADLGRLTSAQFDPQQDPTEFLSAWLVADMALSKTELSGLLSTLRGRISALASEVNAKQPDAGTLALAAKISRLATDNQIEMPAWTLDMSHSIGGDGMVSLDGKAASDPQATFFAAFVGWLPNARARLVLEESAGQLGWHRRRPADPEQTYYGLVISRSLGHPREESAIVAQTKSWLVDVARSSIAAAGARRLYFVLAIANEVGVEIPPQVLTQIRAALDAPGTTGMYLVNLVAIAGMMDMGVGSGTYSTWQAAPTSQPSLLSGYLSWLWGKALGRQDLCSQGMDAVSRYSVGDGTFRSQDAGPADIFSTAIGRRLSVQSPSPIRASSFEDTRGFWHYPVNSSGNILDLQGTYLGLFIGGLIEAPWGVY